jgi:hypothetical protein
MQKYMLLFFGGKQELKYDNLKSVSKEQKDAHLKEWTGWIQKLTSDGKFENGYPFGADGKRIDQTGVSGYHFPPDSAGGFIVITASSIDEAVAIAQESPIIKNGGHILLRQCMEIEK